MASSLQTNSYTKSEGSSRRCWTTTELLAIVKMVPTARNAQTWCLCNMLDLRHHKVAKDHIERFVCGWPGCPTKTKDQDTLDGHLRQIHDRIMWVCPIRTCHRWFGTKRETLQHLEDKHISQSDDAQNTLLDQYRIFDTGELRRQRKVAENTPSKWSRAWRSAIRPTSMMLCATPILLARSRVLSARGNRNTTEQEMRHANPKKKRIKR